jgi:oligoribonuclease NrnB/cAMP/cGMP phosphodiesterase (DHH superfamily)
MDQLRSELASNKKPSELTQANEIRRLDELIAATDSWDRAFQTQLKTITERERLARQLIAETRSAFADWTAAHARMLAAVRTKRVLSASELTETAERIRKLIERFENR